MPQIDLHQVLVRFQNDKEIVTAIDHVDVSFANGKIAVIIGASGSGKSTLLKTVLGFLNYDGEIYFDGVDIETLDMKKKNVSYVSQEYILYPHLTIFDNIAFSLKEARRPREEIIEKVERAAKELGIAHCLSRKPKDLSIGQKQRASIARSLVKNSSLYLFDEPFSNIDEQMTREQLSLICGHLREIGATVIYVTHSVREALQIADTIYVMDQGRVVFQGTPTQAQNYPLDPVATLMRSSFDEKA